MKPTTSFLGLGAMGVPMAAHLAKQAQQINSQAFVWNRSTDKATAHATQYGTTAVSLEKAAEADIIFTCLPTSTEVDEVIKAILPHLKTTQYWVDCTSGHPDAAVRQRALLATHGVRFLDAPVSGGTNGAKAGTLTMMLGGPAEDVEAVRPSLVFAGNIVRVGDTGAGFAVKAINNLLLAVNMWAAGEGLAALKRSQVDLNAALEVINASSGRSNASENLIGQRVFSREFPATFQLGLLAKDAGIALDVIQNTKSSAPIMAQTTSLMRAASHMIGSQTDHTAALQLIEQMNDIELN